MHPILKELSKRVSKVSIAKLPALLDLIEGRAPSNPKALARAVPRLNQIARVLIESAEGDGSILADVERAIVLEAVERCDGNISAAARLLRVDRKTMERRFARAKRSA